MASYADLDLDSHDLLPSDVLDKCTVVAYNQSAGHDRGFFVVGVYPADAIGPTINPEASFDCRDKSQGWDEISGYAGRVCGARALEGACWEEREQATMQQECAYTCILCDSALKEAGAVALEAGALVLEHPKEEWAWELAALAALTELARLEAAVSRQLNTTSSHLETEAGAAKVGVAAGVAAASGMYLAAATFAAGVAAAIILVAAAVGSAVLAALRARRPTLVLV